MFKKIRGAVKDLLSIPKLLITGHYVMAQEGMHDRWYWPRLQRFVTSTTILNGVTSIGEHAFRGCSNLSSITIPDSVTFIGDFAFAGCSNLSSITIPKSVTSIGHGSFLACSKLSTITTPDSVTSIGDYAFYDCSKLSSITIPDSVTSIGNFALYGCSKLSYIIIPDSVTSIRRYAFWDCSNLSSIIIPDSVTSIGDYAFWGCSNLSSINIVAKSKNEYARIISLLPKELQEKVDVFGGSNTVKQDERGVLDSNKSEARNVSEQPYALFNSKGSDAGVSSTHLKRQAGPK